MVMIMASVYVPQGWFEVPGVYKNIEEVMNAQADLVEIVSRFDPKNRQDVR